MQELYIKMSPFYNSFLTYVKNAYFLILYILHLKKPNVGRVIDILSLSFFLPSMQ